ncbi:MAG: N-acetylmannosamine-6-phosphate 2-epimerase [Cyanobacteria bacterium]|nr:N-acetylmannosamine-6-phosphate 2-epimerase [Cyanobacteriota bacterium]
MALSRTLETLKQQVIVSVQADKTEPLYPVLFPMVETVLIGGAAGLRLADLPLIRQVKTRYPDIPVIGITKPDVMPIDPYSQVYITPTLQEVLAVIEAGADIVAMDATARPRPQGETLSAILAAVKQKASQVLLMADCATLEDGISADRLGFDLLGTTLSGYTQETKGNAAATENCPDWSLLESLTAQTSRPVILEGRVWEPTQIPQAFAKKAWAVVIGSAITRPHHITARFVRAAKQSQSVD